MMRKQILLALLLPLASHAAIVRVGHVFNGSTAVFTSLTQAYAPTTGNTVFVAVTTWATVQPTLPTISDGGTNTYTLLGSQFDGIRSATHLWRSSNVTGGSFTYTYSQTGTSYINLFVVEYSGLAISSPADGFQAGTGTAPTITSPSITTTSASDLLFSVISSAESANLSFAAGAGWTLIDQTNGAVSTLAMIMEQIVSSTGTYTATASMAGSGSPYSVLFSATKGLAAAGNRVTVTVN